MRMRSMGRDNLGLGFDSCPPRLSGSIYVVNWFRRDWQSSGFWLQISIINTAAEIACVLLRKTPFANDKTHYTRLMWIIKPAIANNHK